MCRKLFLLTSFVLAMGLICMNPALGAEIVISTADGGDDAEQHLDDGDMDIGSSDLEIPSEDAGDPASDAQVIGLRFVNVLVIPGGQVGGAYVEFEVDKTNKEGSLAPVNVIIEGELTADANAFEDIANNLTDRATTTAKVLWTIPEAIEQNAKFQTPDVNSIIQEIVDQNDWVPGNAIVLLFRDDPDNPSTGLRELESQDGESDAAPTLYMTAPVIPVATQPSPADGAGSISTAPLC